MRDERARSRLAPVAPDPVAAILPVDILVDPDARGEAGWLEAQAADAVRPERLRPGTTVVAGWGNVAWRARIRQTGSLLQVTPPPDAPLATAAPERWLEEATTAMSELLPASVDGATRHELARRILAAPRFDLQESAKAIQLLAGAHNTLRWCARRVLLQSVATQRLARELSPGRTATWHVLARLTRTPAARLTGTVGTGVLIHDASPQCPTARRLRDG